MRKQRGSTEIVLAIIIGAIFLLACAFNPAGVGKRLFAPKGETHNVTTPSVAGGR